MLLIMATSSNTVFASIEDDKANLENQKISILQQIETSQNNKTTAHTIAETARGIGLSEEDSIIARAKEIWAYNDNWQHDLNKQLHEIEEQIIRLSKYSYAGEFKLTGYCNCSKCCGKWANGKTASGTYPAEGRTVAAPKQYPLGTKLYIEGLGEYIVEDRGNLGNNVIDVYSNTHSGCYKAEYNRTAKVYVINE